MVTYPPDVERVITFLRSEWEKPFRITTVSQAQAALGIPDDASLRLRIGAYLADHLELSDRLSRWGAAVFVLTEDEKLLARHVRQTLQHSGGVPTVAELGQACGLSPGEVDLGLQALVSLGFVEPDGQSYTILEDFEGRAGGLGFNFHIVTLENGERFNVP